MIKYFLFLFPCIFLFAKPLCQQDPHFIHYKCLELEARFFIIEMLTYQLKSNEIAEAIQFEINQCKAALHGE